MALSSARLHSQSAFVATAAPEWSLNGFGSLLLLNPVASLGGTVNGGHAARTSFGASRPRDKTARYSHIFDRIRTDA
jgi:hypothetical protein